MSRLIAPCVAAALVSLAGCATSPSPSDAPQIVRSRPPQNVESTVASYFDLTGAPANRRLAFSAPETSPCPLLGGGGMHTGWVVPVVYDTSGGKGKAPAGGAGKSTAAQATPAQLATSGTVSMDQISITGTRYFFWFSSDTLSAVTRRIDQCP